MIVGGCYGVELDLNEDGTKKEQNNGTEMWETSESKTYAAEEHVHSVAGRNFAGGQATGHNLQTMDSVD